MEVFIPGNTVVLTVLVPGNTVVLTVLVPGNTVVLTVLVPGNTVVLTVLLTGNTVVLTVLLTGNTVVPDGVPLVQLFPSLTGENFIAQSVDLTHATHHVHLGSSGSSEEQSQHVEAPSDQGSLLLV